MKSLLQLMLVLLALVLMGLGGSLTIPDGQVNRVTGPEQHTSQVNSAALWDRQASGTEQAEVLTSPAITGPNTGRTHRTMSHPAVHSVSLNAGRNCLTAGINHHCRKALRLLQAPLQHGVASHYYVIVLRHIIR